MQVPRIIYGTYREVNAQLRNEVIRLRRAQDWNDLVDTAILPGLEILNGPSPLLDGDPHFHCFLPLTIFLERIDTARLPSEVEQEIFEASLRTAWGTLGLLSPANRIWVFPQERHLPLLRAAYHFWETLDAEGARYTVGSATGAPLWSIGSNLKYVMANHGVPSSVLNAPLPERGPASLMPLDKG